MPYEEVHTNYEKGYYLTTFCRHFGYIQVMERQSMTVFFDSLMLTA